MITMGLNLMNNFEALLKEKGYKLTEQRQIIWRVMAENIGEHLSAKEIREIAREKDDTIGMATVYRAVQIMDDLGIITSIGKKDAFNKYELITGEESCMHPHLICLHCGKIIGVAENLLISDPEVKILNEYNFEIEDIRVKCYGLCEECARKQCK